MSLDLQQVVGYGILIVAVFFALVGSIGVLRLPDFYTRAHAATKPDTLGMALAMIGMAVLNGVNTTTFKLLLIMIFVAIANPAAAHALGRAAVRCGLAPWKRGDAPAVESGGSRDR